MVGAGAVMLHMRRRRSVWAGSGERVVYLVGAGPGAPDLISVRGAKAIEGADFLVYDRLVSPELVSLAREGATLINVGKGPEKKRFPQSEINELLVKLGTNTHPGYQVKAGAKIVRVKGGDPFVFGLGGEEVIELAKRGVRTEIVPGMSSATAVPGCSNIPLTHKGVASSFTVLSGHIPPGSDKPGGADWDNLPRSLSTLVILMGVKSLRAICTHLVENCDWDGTTPAAVIESGTTRKESILVSNLAQLPEASEKAGCMSPAIIVIGNVCTILPENKVSDRKYSDNSSEVWGKAREVVNA